MSTDTLFTLGNVSFQHTEVPEKIQIGGEQKLAVHDLVGGQKVIDALGRDDAPLEWSGLLLGPNAPSRFRQINAMRVAGRPVTLSWGECLYRVMIQSFVADYERETQMPYRIVCEVLEDLNASISSGQQSQSPDSVLNEDLAASRVEALNVHDTPLTSLLNTLDNAIIQVTRIANATHSAIARIRQPIDDILDRTEVLMHQTNRALAAASSVGDQATGIGLRLLEQIEATARMTTLLRLRAAMGRLRNNLDALHTRGKQITVAGGSLYNIAAHEYGNAMDWTAIAAANSLTDPEIDGIKTLTIPPRTDSSGGVLNA
jgi:hypothetical protein